MSIWMKATVACDLCLNELETDENDEVKAWAEALRLGWEDVADQHCCPDCVEGAKAEEEKEMAE